MAAQKRPIEDTSTSRKVKKLKTESEKNKSKLQPNGPSTLLTEVDFPRGGGSSFTPLEVKAIRAEAVKEANAELFKDASTKNKSKKKKADADKSTFSEGKERIRIEHLNYKRMNVGMKIFGQIVNILPLALIVSLPNQLYGHIPITNISSQFTELLERLDAQELRSNHDEIEEDTQPLHISELTDIFNVGQYVRAVVSTVHAPGTTDVSGVGKSRDENIKASKRVELSLIPERVNTGVSKSDLKQGFTLTAAVKSREDHGYTLDLGISDVSGFLPFKELEHEKDLHIGTLIDITVVKASANGRICTVSADSTKFSTSYLSEVSSVTSLLPGTLVQGLITSVHTSGLNLQVLGYFAGTIDEYHIEERSSAIKVGKKVKARVIYDFSSSPPRFALSLMDHVVRLTPRLIRDGETERSVREAYPVGTVLEEVKVVRLEPERGLTAEISDNVQGFVHISQASDDHLPSLSNTGPWKPGSIHVARVIGSYAFDGLLQLSLKPSVIQQKYFQVADATVGEVIKGTIKKLTDTSLFVSLAGGIDAVVWPNHYADIMLKHPAKRFKEGGNLKCRVLVVDPDRNRISLTAKKTLLESTLPIISKIDDVKAGMVTHAVVLRTYEKHLVVEFYNNIKATIPLKETGATSSVQLSETFPTGKVVQVRILGMDESRITASIKQASSDFDIPDISSIEIGTTVEGIVSEIHKDNILLILQPTRARALLSVKNLANHRSQTVAQLRTALQTGEKFEELVVVSKNPEKGLVIVANKPKAKPSLLIKGSDVTIESINVGQVIGGRVTRHIKNGALVKITSHIGGVLHFTDLSDNFDSGAQLPRIDSIIKAAVVGVNVPKKQLALSTRPSRMHPDQSHEVVDREINDLSELEVGQTVRGFVKNVMEHGVFVTVGRDIDARVQIKELFEEYIKEWQEHIKIRQVVNGRIFNIDAENKKLEMTFRSDDPSTRQPSAIRLGDLKEGQKVEGTVRKIEDYGLFIQITGSKLNGLCHKSQLSDNPDAEVKVALQGFREGDRVKALILKIENRRISLGLKPSYFSTEDFEDEDEAIEGQEDANSADDNGLDCSSGPEDVDMTSDQENSDDEGMQIDIDSHQVAYKATPSSSNPLPSIETSPALHSLGGFQWSSNPQAIEEDAAASSSSDGDDDMSTKPTKKKRKRKQIEQDLTADLHIKQPESNADFERLLLGSPNSSYLWIQYMSFQLPLSEVDKAREIARRAINTINFREEQERSNVWIALLNLENVYGTDETLEAIFKEATRANDSKTVHLRLASIFEQSDKPEKAEEQYKRTCKKFGQSSKVWSLFGQFLSKRGEVEEARKILPRSLQSLEKRKHLKTISQFALLEYKHGEPERGKTLFEGIIDSHPRRWDMWSIYMDMEANQKNIQGLRNLFDRIFALKMTSHKAKVFFKKWLELEKRLGDDEGVETVKQRAIDWTQRAAEASNES